MVIVEEKTEVLYDQNEIVRRVVERSYTIKYTMDGCIDVDGPSMLVIPDHPVTKAFADMKSRGVRIRFISEITKNNVQYCKELMKIGEIRHLDEVKGNFGIADGSVYHASATGVESGPPPQLIISTVRAVVDQQQYFFDMLWEKAVAAEDRIREIEEGITPEFIDTLSDSNEIQELGYQLVKSAKQEVLVIFSTARAFLRQEKAGLIKLVKEAAVMRGLKVRILVPINDLINQLIVKLRKEGEEGPQEIDIRNIERPLQSWVTILVVDRILSLVVEVRDDTKDDSHEAIGLATYSNSKSTVLSYASIFESLWIQSELYEKLDSANKQLKVNDKIQREFINIAAHELRSPIQPILGLTEVLRSRINDNEARELIDVIVRNAKRLQRLTENVLDVTKIESQSLQLNRDLCRLNDIISTVIQDYKNRIDNLKLKLLYEPANDINNSLIFADKGRLQQVISNLLDNAIKFTKNEGGSILITTERGDTNDSQIIFSIKDCGEGIDPEVLQKLFSKFSTKSTTGTGLGLYISKSIIEAHGGRIWASNNTDGKGTTFAFGLPVSEQIPS